MAKTNQGLSLTKTGLLELKQRVIFVLIAIVVYRVGCHIPVPGLDPQKVIDLFSQHKNGIINLFNMFSGGALSG